MQTEAAFSLHDIHSLAAYRNKSPLCVESALRALNPHVCDSNSGSLQILLALHSDCHFIFPAVSTTQMFIYVSRINFHFSLKVRFRWCWHINEMRLLCVYVGRTWTDYYKTISWNIHHHKWAKLAYYSATVDILAFMLNMMSEVIAYCLPDVLPIV